MRDLKSKTGARIFAFESMAEITNYVDPTVFAGMKERGNTDEKWRGGKFQTWQDVQDKAVSAWEEGMMILTDAVDTLRKEVLPDLKSHKRVFVWSYDTGDEIDLERMAAGEPYWKHYTSEATTGPTEVTIITDTTTPWTMDPQDVLWRGAAAVALAVLLEEKGYKVELWVVCGSYLFRNSNKGVCMACQLKKTSDVLDVSTLINTMSGWFYRNSTFSLMETVCLKNREQVNHGYGGCYPPQPQDLDEISRDEYRVYSSGVYTYNGALGVICSEMAKFAAKE